LPSSRSASARRRNLRAKRYLRREVRSESASTFQARRRAFAWHAACAGLGVARPFRRAREFVLPAPRKRNPKLQATLAERAALLRARSTSSEAALWALLSGGKLGVSFRRQVPLGRYIADFVAPSAKLIVEVDGGYHSRRAIADARRDRNLRRLGYRVVHLPAELVLSQPAAALELVLAAVASTCESRDPLGGD
jgi:very-short-patch-repair endonuclease